MLLYPMNVNPTTRYWSAPSVTVKRWHLAMMSEHCKLPPALSCKAPSLGPRPCRRSEDAAALQLQMSELKAELAGKVDATSLKVGGRRWQAWRQSM